MDASYMLPWESEITDGDVVSSELTTLDKQRTKRGGSEPLCVGPKGNRGPRGPRVG